MTLTITLANVSRELSNFRNTQANRSSSLSSVLDLEIIRELSFFKYFHE